MISSSLALGLRLALTLSQSHLHDTILFVGFVVDIDRGGALLSLRSARPAVSPRHKRGAMLAVQLVALDSDGSL